MVWLDYVIILAVLAAIVRGIELGFVRQLFSTVGFFGGLFLGVWLSEHIFHSTSPTGSFGIVIGTAIALLIISEGIANIVKTRIRFTPIDAADRSLGSIVAAVAIVIAVWLGASIFSSTPYPNIQQQLRDSYIVSKLQNILPDAPQVIDAFGHLVTPNGFPEVFTGREPAPIEDVPIPDMGELTAAVNRTKDSVVKIEGEGCGGIVNGSGFVADNGLIVTNAHVIAGVKYPKVIDKNGTHRATVLAFNTDKDLAVLRSIDLVGKPLELTTSIVPDGTESAVLGYPGGGTFKADPAAIIDAFNATGKNIYNQGVVVREIYSLQADVISGNSGGPVINKQGAVIGVVFAQSVAHQDVGYALTMPQVIHELNQAKSSNQAVGTGSCAQ